MSHCHECGKPYMDGAFFCGECGANLLLASASQLTVEVPTPSLAEHEHPTRPLDYRLGFGIKADRIVFVIPSTGRRLQAGLDRTVWIGRLDTRQGIWPEVDLTRDQGAENGVSRKHALVRNSDEGVVLVDLGSTNGTRVNDRRLPPERPYLLRDGDVIRFGNLVVRVYFEA